MHQYIKFILFWNDTLHVYSNISRPLSSSQQYLFDKCLLPYVQSRMPDDGWKDCLKHVQCHSKKKNK